MVNRYGKAGLLHTDYTCLYLVSTELIKTNHCHPEGEADTDDRIK